MMRIMRENPAFVLGVIVFVVADFVGTIFLVYGMKSSGGGRSGRGGLLGWVCVLPPRLDRRVIRRIGWIGRRIVF